MTIPRQRMPGGRTVPPWLAVTLVVLGGAGAAAQAAVNARLGDAMASPLSAAVISNTVGGVVFIVAWTVSARVRRGLVRAWRNRLPWWMYTGGVFGAVFVFAGAYAVPLLGVAVFTIAQVCGNTMGGLAGDAAGLGPGGRLRASLPRVTAVGLAVVAVVLAQTGRVVDLATWWLVPVVMLIGASLALQGAFNGRVNEVTGNPLSTGLVNFAFGTGVLYVFFGVVAMIGVVPDVALPSQPWLYLGGVFGACLVVVSMIAVRVIGVLRLAIGVLTGQLAGAVALDVFAGTEVSGWVLSAVMLTAVAGILAGLSRSSATPHNIGRRSLER